MEKPVVKSQKNELLGAYAERYRWAKLGRMLKKELRCPHQHFHVVPILMANQLQHVHLKGLKWKDICLVESEGY